MTDRTDSTGTDRRALFRGTALTAAGAALALALPAIRSGGSVIPAAQAQPKAPPAFDYPGKHKGLAVLGDRPLVAETPEHLLDDDTTPNDKFFVRNNGQLPEEEKNPDSWKITIEGEVNQKLEITLGELK